MELARSRGAAAKVPTLRAQLEAAQDQARTGATMVVSEFLASEEMIKLKDSSYDACFDVSLRDFTYTVVTEHLDWDLSFLSKKLSALVDKWRDQWRASLPQLQSDEPLVPPSDELLRPLFGELPRPSSSELPVIPPPPEVHPKQVIEGDLGSK